MDLCVRVLKESNKSRFDSYSVRNTVLIVSHIAFQDDRMHILYENLSQNSCRWYHLHVLCFTSLSLSLSISFQLCIVPCLMPLVLLQMSAVFV